MTIKHVLLAGMMATTVALACLPTAARAMTGNELWSVCAGKDDANKGICLGFVMAIAEAVDPANGLSGWRACLPQESTMGQIQDIVTRWLYRHPEQRHYSAHSLVAEALAEAFPCKQ